ncbi:hypothetical protein K435DRAFT_860677 [Dendrothele bispora CBS 962.96]|uniref:Uncharacterized protein n=1 Tax=Dendrothele bispora (strain CBS 962.96) TaxID=1314807 RepID=A0A4V4HFC1_DENBC|nr:hypothetical protein K435DRAFT_860677 [Dendrothele bispora CBS 962.96]
MAKTCAHGVLGSERMTGCGRMPTKSLRELYTALVDCHLISGSETTLDVNLDGLAELESVQIMFLRWMLGLSKSSIRTVLFTETAIRPIGVRRTLLALSYLHYLMERPPTSLANLAFKASASLRASGNSCWLMDLDWVIQHLPGEHTLFLPQNDDLTVANLELLTKAIKQNSNSVLLNEINSYSRLSLLQGRIEPTDPEDNLEPRSPVLCFRHYLHRVSNYRHRRSVTRLICGDLCPMTFRSSPGRRPKPEDVFDLKCCRGCRQQYETPEHVLLQCLHVPEIVDLRHRFLSSVNIDPNLERRRFSLEKCLKQPLLSPHPPPSTHQSSTYPHALKYWKLRLFFWQCFRKALEAFEDIWWSQTFFEPGLKYRFGPVVSFSLESPKAASPVSVPGPLTLVVSGVEGVSTSMNVNPHLVGKGNFRYVIRAKTLSSIRAGEKLSFSLKLPTTFATTTLALGVSVVRSLSLLPKRTNALNLLQPPETRALLLDLLSPFPFLLLALLLRSTQSIL